MNGTWYAECTHAIFTDDLGNIAASGPQRQHVAHDNVLCVVNPASLYILLAVYFVSQVLPRRAMAKSLSPVNRSTTPNRKAQATTLILRNPVILQTYHATSCYVRHV
jgi:hypothetical protein